MSIKKFITPEGDVKWDVRIYAEGRGSKRIFRRFDRKIDADRFVDDHKRQKRDKELNPFKGMSLQERTFKDEAIYWFEDGKNRFSAAHLKRCEGFFKEALPEFGHLTLDKFTPEFLTRYQQALKKTGQANATVNRKTEMITAILNFSAKQRRIPFTPATGFRKLNKNQPEMNFLRKEEALDFLSFVNQLYPKSSPQRWIYVSYQLALNTAMRAGEIWGLAPMDLDQDGEAILVRRQFNRVTQDFGPTKSRKSRLVPCPAELTLELKELIRAREIGNEETIFMNEERNPICHDNFTDRQFQKDVARWGGRRIRFHDLRHTATTLMIAAGVDIKTVKEICGHADISTTMNYVHMVPGAIQRVSRSFNLSPAAESNVIPFKRSEG